MAIPMPIRECGLGLGKAGAGAWEQRLSRCTAAAECAGAPVARAAYVSKRSASLMAHGGADGMGAVGTIERQACVPSPARPMTRPMARPMTCRH